MATVWAAGPPIGGGQPSPGVVAARAPPAPSATPTRRRCWPSTSTLVAPPGDIREAILRGIIFHESGGQLAAVNGSSGAFGLTQFEPQTAAQYGVKPGDAQSQITGAAHYLHDLGFAKNPVNALDHHYGGAGAGGYYAAVQDIIRQRGYGAGGTAAAPSSSTTTTSGGGAGTSGLVKGLVRVGFVIGGAVTAGVGVARMVGIGKASVRPTQ